MNLKPLPLQGRHVRNHPLSLLSRMAPQAFTGPFIRSAHHAAAETLEACPEFRQLRCGLAG